MENIQEFLGFLMIYGAAIIVIAILLNDVIRRKPAVRPFLKWLTVILLSVWQVGCMR